MSRRYSDPIEVRCAEAAAADRPRPVAFLWHGRVYLVRDVLSQWVEAGAWWRSAVGRLTLGADPGGPGKAPGPDVRGSGLPAGGVRVGDPGTGTADRAGDPGDRWVWRVEAVAGRSATVGVYDLSCHEGEWRLARALD